MNIFSGGKIQPLTPSAKAEAAYKKPAVESGKAGDTRAKTDTIELSGRSAQGVQKQLPALGSSILYEVSKSADPQRLSAMAKAARSVGRPNAAVLLADAVEAIASVMPGGQANKGDTP